MMFAVIGQGCCMAILAGTVWDGSHASGLVATVMLFLFNFFFGTGLLAIPWLCKYSLGAVFTKLSINLIPHKTVPAEYSPLAIRTRSAAMATATNCEWKSTYQVRKANTYCQGSAHSSSSRSRRSVSQILDTRPISTLPVRATYKRP